MSYKVFTNGSPLPASDLNDFLMKQSVITFANATERDATLTAPTEGMCVYLENNNHFQIYSGTAWVTQNPINARGDLIIGDASGNPTRLAVGANGSLPIVGSGTLGYLPIGTNGQVLQSNGTTATWVTQATAGAEDWTELVALTTPIPTGSTTASLSGLSGRSKYLLIVDGVSSANASSNFTIRINNTTNLYQSFGTRIIGAATYAPGNMESIQTNNAVTFASMSATASSFVTGAFFISGANTGNHKYFEWNGVGTASGSNGNSANFGRGMWRQNSLVTSIELVSSTGNIDAGNWALYGSTN